jgi:RNA polymerase sigma-70 factor (ECF subfamily)
VPEEPTDRALATAITGAGDEAAFRQLFRRHSPALFRIAARLTDGGDAAEEIVHDTWLRAVDRLPRFEWRSSLRTWLTGILLNLAREDRRRRSRALQVAGEPGEAPGRLEPLDDRFDLEEAIAKLPPGYREAVVLHDIEGYGHEEIADLLGIQVGTSKSQLSRARQALRGWLTEKQ